MPEHSKEWIDNTTLRVMTYKSGSFTFQLGTDITYTQVMLDRVNDAQNRFNKMPALPSIIDQIQEKVLASSVYSTNTIEGGNFTEEETQNILKKDPKTVQKNEEIRLINLKEAIDWVKGKKSKKFNPLIGQEIDLRVVIELHRLVSKNLSEQHNPVGEFRNNQPTQKTIVGNSEHGGAYRPPKCLADIEYLMVAWVEWLNSPHIINQPAIIRACLAHYYFELIHPFWDGNGRTGRLIEMLILEQSGYAFSSSAIWAYYQKNIHEYFTLFNHCRQLAKNKEINPNQKFIDFASKGMFETIEFLHDESNQLIRFLLFQTHLNQAKFQKIITDRQFDLIQFMLIHSVNKSPCSKAELYRTDNINKLYTAKTDRTFYRDIDKLIELGFLVEEDGKVLFIS